MISDILIIRDADELKQQEVELFFEVKKRVNELEEKGFNGCRGISGLKTRSPSGFGVPSQIGVPSGVWGGCICNKRIVDCSIIEWESTRISFLCFFCAVIRKLNG